MHISLFIFLAILCDFIYFFSVYGGGGGGLELEWNVRLCVCEWE